MDLDDLLEDLWDDVVGDAREKAGRAGQQLRRRARMPAFRRRMREAALWGSAGWFTTFGGMGVATELAVDGGIGTAIAIVLYGIALPALPAGVWAWRSRQRDRPARREAEATRRAKQERDDLPVDVVADWKRLRRAQVLVEDLAEQGYVDAHALGEQTAMVGELRELLIADRRATELGAEPSRALRRQVGDLADLLVALAAEAVDHRSEEVERSDAPATLRDARDRLTSLRAARAEVNAVDEDAARANELVERARRARAEQAPTASAAPPGRPSSRRPQGRDDEDDTRGTPRATPG